MHRLANPAVYNKLYSYLFPLTLGLALILLVSAFYLVFSDFKPDYLQGYTVAFIYLHVPAAMMGSGFYALMTLSAAGYMIWRHPLALAACRVMMPIGMVFVAITLLTGMFWGKPAWGAWWVWDSRLVSVLILLWIYIAIMILFRATETVRQGGQIVALFVIIGALILPVIHFSVEFWNSIHQGQSISLMGTNKVDESMLLPLWLSILGFGFLGTGLTLYGLRTENLERKLHRQRLKLTQDQD